MSRAEARAHDTLGEIWVSLRGEAEAASQEAVLASLVAAVILRHRSLGEALACQLARKLGDREFGELEVRELVRAAYADDADLVAMAEADLEAVRARDPACTSYLTPFLFFKGFLALQAQRVAHWLWRQDRRALALHLQSRMSERLHVDIHPAARVGRGIYLDHGTGVVIGETAVVGDGVSLFHEVTLGGTGAGGGDRHPKIGDGVLLTAGARVLGAITVGDNAKVAAESVVLSDVPPGCTAVGVPARLVNRPTK